MKSFRFMFARRPSRPARRSHGGMRNIPDRIVVFGVPLLLALLISVCGWPFPWRGEERQGAASPSPVQPTVDSQPRAGPARGAQAAGAVESAATDPTGPEGVETGTVAELREKLERARGAQLETSSALANLRARHERELETVGEERDRLALQVAELQAQLAANYARRKELSRLREEGAELRERNRTLESELSLLRAARIDESRSAERRKELLDIQARERRAERNEVEFRLELARARAVDEARLESVAEELRRLQRSERNGAVEQARRSAREWRERAEVLSRELTGLRESRKRGEEASRIQAEAAERREHSLRRERRQREEELEALRQLLRMSQERLAEEIRRGEAHREEGARPGED